MKHPQPFNMRSLDTFFRASKCSTKRWTKIEANCFLLENGKKNSVETKQRRRQVIVKVTSFSGVGKRDGSIIVLSVLMLLMSLLICKSKQQFFVPNSGSNQNHHSKLGNQASSSNNGQSNFWSNVYRPQQQASSLSASLSSLSQPSSSNLADSTRSHRSTSGSRGARPFSMPSIAQASEGSTNGDNLHARQLSFRGPRNSSWSSNSLGSWHFPKFSPEQAAEMLITGAQVINRIAQAETPLNYCKTPDNQEGECSDVRKCMWLLLDKVRLKQSVCLRNLIIPAVCCPVASNNSAPATSPLAEMVQSTLEPVFFRPKPSKSQSSSSNGNGLTSQKKKTSYLAEQLPNLINSVMNMPSAQSAAPSAIKLRNSTTTSSPSVSHLNASSVIHYEVPNKSSSNSSSDFEYPSPTQQVIELYTKPPHNPSTSTSTTSTTTTTTTTTASSHQTLFQDDQENGQPSYTRIASRKYPWANETCGESGRTRTGRIVGGSDSKLGQWPWMTAMYLNKRHHISAGPGEFWCGGALINRRYILTAAHCLADQRGFMYKNDQVTIKLGGVDLVRHQAPAEMTRNQASAPWTYRASSSAGSRSSSDADEDAEFSWTSFITKALGLGGGGSSSSSSSNGSGSGSHQSASTNHDGSTKSINSDSSKRQQLANRAKRTYFKEYRVASIKQHPNFTRHGFYNDIGLIELKTDVDYDDLISPICLPSEHDIRRDLSGYMATVLGWGTLSYGGQGSKLLQQVAMPIWKREQCDDRYLQSINKTFLCAGFISGGKDACQGDSGGPLMVSDKSGKWTLHGLVSFGKTCAQPNYPGVYTRVTEFLDWIRDNTNPDGYSHSSAGAVKV